jgi:hypothetical protein
MGSKAATIAVAVAVAGFLVMTALFLAETRRVDELSALLGDAHSMASELIDELEAARAELHRLRLHAPRD